MKMPLQQVLVTTTLPPPRTTFTWPLCMLHVFFTSGDGMVVVAKVQQRTCRWVT
jgi:hypothetical protein